LKPINPSNESIYNIDHAALCLHFETHGCPHPQTTADKVFNHLYRQRRPAFSLLEVAKISKKAMQVLEESFSFARPHAVKIVEASDQTVKFIMAFADGQSVETVLIPFPGRYSTCLSTQVGCAMKCSFCHTGTQGLKRHLTAGEIIGQYLVAWDWLEQNRPQEAAQPKIVFMGQGEPLHNFEAVKKAIHMMVSTRGLQLGARRMTLSTSGFLPGLLRFHELPHINLALSLHSPFSSVRSELIPINRSYPLETVLEAIDAIPFKKCQAINFEYLLIAGKNDREEDAVALGHLLRGKRGIVNLIPFNEFPGSVYARPTEEQTIIFQNQLRAQGLQATVRTTKGSDILAACGQLKVTVPVMEISL
jgi:23S rRNA (adenine2503-C2)-methyltransferase